MRPSFLILGLALDAFLFGELTAQNKAAAGGGATEVCQAMTDIEKHDGQDVTLGGIMEWSFQHGVWIASPLCKDEITLGKRKWYPALWLILPKTLDDPALDEETRKILSSIVELKRAVHRFHLELSVEVKGRVDLRDLKRSPPEVVLDHSFPGRLIVRAVHIR